MPKEEYFDVNEFAENVRNFLAELRKLHNADVSNLVTRFEDENVKFLEMRGDVFDKWEGTQKVFD